MDGTVMGKGIMTKWQVYNQKKDLPICCGVYAIYKDENIIYVGVSNNIRKRFSKHEIKDWDYVKLKPAPTFGYAHDLEAKLIKKLKPKLNSQGADRTRLSTRHRLTIYPDTYKRFRAFCYQHNLKTKQLLNDIINGFLKAAEDAK